MHQKKNEDPSRKEICQGCQDADFKDRFCGLDSLTQCGESEESVLNIKGAPFEGGEPQETVRDEVLSFDN